MQLLTIKQFTNLTKSMALKYLFDFALKIERDWPNQASRLVEIEQLKDYLLGLGAHKDGDLRQLAKLTSKFCADMSLKHFLGIIIPLERNFNRTVCDDEILICEGDRKVCSSKTIPLTIILDNVRSAFNVGAIFRTAECLGAARIFLCGYTATPDNLKVKKTAMGTDAVVASKWLGHAHEALDVCSSEGIAVVALETVANSRPIESATFPRPCAIILGNERYGLGKDVIKRASFTAHIPLFGRKNSLNIGIACGILGYEIRRQWLGSIGAGN